MSEKTKKQHYVSQFYLKGWTHNNHIFCKRRNSQIFKTTTANVAHERFFYEKEPLTPEEIDLIEQLLKGGPQINQLCNLSSLEAYVAVCNSQNDANKFGIEWFHSMNEDKAAPVLQALREGRGDVLDHQQSKIELCLYLGHQYMRTKKIKESYNESSLQGRKIPNCDFRKIYEAMAFIHANTVGSAICSHLDLKLIKNESGKNLITSDQPIYNISAIPGEMPKEFSVYFPISPQYALWAKKAPNDERIDTPEQAVRLNTFMANNSLDLVFASEEEDLLKF